MPLRLRLILLLAFLSVLPLAGRTQESATLVADSLRIEGDSQLIAEGTVEVLFQGRRMTASKIIFDQANDQLFITGPIRLSDPDGKTIILADQAELSSDMTEGILQSARVVLDQQLQIAATQMRRVQGRYLQLDNAVASACRVCASGETPLWEIRASRVLHDQQERQIYFDHAQFRLAGLPVFYIPRLRVPDPTLDRATGFLLPKLSGATGLGTGLRMPYFIVLGPSRDLTLTPYLTTQSGRTVEFRYREALRSGGITVQGALSRDQIRPGELRGYLLATGNLALPRGFRLDFVAEGVSDDTYLADYGTGDKDLLTSSLTISRVQREEYVGGRLSNIRTLRAEENDSATPYLISDAVYQRRFTFGGIGGEGNLRFQTMGYARSSSDPTDGSDLDDIAEGADVTRLSFAADWRKDWTFGPGVIGAVLGEVRADAYSVSQDNIYAGSPTREQAALGGELRWPWLKSTTAGATHVIEPVAQVIWSSAAKGLIPNEDSRLVEFDEASLFSVNRFPGIDAVETGLRANIGVSWTRIDADGWSLGATVGRVLRDGDVPSFSNASGLSTQPSDWMASMQLETASGLSLAGRVIMDDYATAKRSEVHLSYDRPRFGVNSTYIWSIADVTEARPEDVSEIVLGGNYKLAGNWAARGSGRYDFAADAYSRADFGLTFRNECLEVILSLSRRFTTSTNLSASTTADVSVDLIGFGGRGKAGPARVCSR